MPNINFNSDWNYGAFVPQYMYHRPTNYNDMCSRSMHVPSQAIDINIPEVKDITNKENNFVQSDVLSNQGLW